MNWLARLKQRFGDPARSTGDTLSPFTDPAVKALRDAAADAQRSRLPQMAAALSYRTIFGLIPVMVVALVLVRANASEETRNEVIKRALDYTGISSISVREADFVGPPTAIESIDSGNLSSQLTELIRHAESMLSFSAVGWIGFATLLYAAIAMLVEVERAFNQVFRVPRGRSWVRRVVNYWTLLTLGTIGLIATFYVGARFQAWAANISETRGWTIGSGTLTVQLIGYAVTVSISTLMLMLAYESVPNTRVRPFPAFLGAFLAALLWEAGKFGFGQYLAYSSGYARLYGSLALIPLFLIWVYYTWLIVLFGLEVTYQLQHGRSKTSAQPLSDYGPTVIEPSAGLLIMTAIARAMATGTPQSVRALTQTTGLSEPVVSLVVSRFAERGLLLRVERGGDPTANTDPLYSLARTPGSIRIAEILAIGFELAGGPEGNQVVARMRQAQIDAAGSETLADASGLASDSPARVIVATVQNPPNSPALPAPPAPSNGSAAARPATLR